MEGGIWFQFPELIITAYITDFGFVTVKTKQKKGKVDDPKK